MSRNGRRLKILAFSGLLAAAGLNVVSAGQSWAICAAPVAGHTVVVTVGVATSASPKTVISTCPAGHPVHGVGFITVGAGVGEVFLNAAFPNQPLPVGTSVPITASEDQGGGAGNWAIRTFAICAL